MAIHSFFDPYAVKRFKNLSILLCWALAATLATAQKPVLKTTNGKVSLRSVATLEIIQAQSGQLRGVLDPNNQSFAWSVEISSFEGFNSPLQREHFNENYMESDRFPKASFTGKIIEQLDLSQSTPQTVRAKGKLSIHGIEQERIIKCQLTNNGGKWWIKSTFTIPVADHNITIPKIVHQKIAEEIMVSVEALLTQ